MRFSLSARLFFTVVLVRGSQRRVFGRGFTGGVCILA